MEELLVELDLDKKSIVVGASRVRAPLICRQGMNPADVVCSWIFFSALSKVFMKRGVLRYLEQQRDQQVSGWLVNLQAACMGHQARQKYRRLKVSVSHLYAGQHREVLVLL